MAETLKVEYRIKEVKRYIITRYEETENIATSREKGTYDSADMAYEVAYALCKHDHEKLGWPIADDRIQYPVHPAETNSVFSGNTVSGSVGYGKIPGVTE